VNNKIINQQNNNKMIKKPHLTVSLLIVSILLGIGAFWHGQRANADIRNPITVINPQGGEMFYQAPQKTIYISWSVTGNPPGWQDVSKANADLYKYNPTTRTYTFVRLLENNIANFNCGNYYAASYPVPNNVPAGNDYVIRISSFPDSTYYAYSGRFAISSEIPGITSIVINSPSNPGLKLVRGTTETVEWTTNGKESQIHIWWARGGAVPIPPMTAICYPSNVSLGVIPNTPNSGTASFSWSIPNNMAIGNDYKLWIYGTTNGVSDVSDFNFSIVERLNFTSPQGGEQWYEGQSRDITWTPISSTPSNTIVSLVLKRTSDTNYSKNIGSALNIDGHYLWAIPHDISISGKPAKTDLYISAQVTSGGQFVSKGTSNEFTIFDAPEN
jgi:hypothetical protein